MPHLIRARWDFSFLKEFILDERAWGATVKIAEGMKIFVRESNYNQGNWKGLNMK